MSETTTPKDGLGDITLASGPWSFESAPADAAFIDCGPLKLPYIEGLNAEAELDSKTRVMGAISVLVNDSSVQLKVVAAPRGSGQWSDTRRKITAQMSKRPGTQHAIEGHFGTELIVTLTGRTPDGLLGDATLRFVGLDGDRWMIRAVVSGPSATSDATVERVNALLSRCAVERGDDALAAGTVMPLRPPAGQIELEDSGENKDSSGE